MRSYSYPSRVETAQTNRSRIQAASLFRGRRRARVAGMTIIEVLLSLGVLSMALITGVGSLLQHVARNRQIGMEVAGLQAINKIMGEVEDLADTAPLEKTMAYAVVDHFAKMTVDLVEMGPNRAKINRIEEDLSDGSLVYRFWVPAPGENYYPESSPMFRPNYRAMGEMRIYLDEAKLNNDILPRFAWTDLSGSPVASESGIDLNLNGDKTDDLLGNYISIKQLAISFNVNYYTDESHKGITYSTSRDILLCRIKDATKNFDPTVP